MRSKMLFNKNFFIQNILKSKTIIAVLLGIIPILNAIMIITINQGSDVQFADLNEISILNILGLYVIPVVLAFCMLGYVFKKKSVDFINSMPLSRKEIYVTSVVGGIILIFLMQLLNAIILIIESTLFTNLIIPFNMILDYFIVWTISYIFVFLASILATCVSGNHVTMIIVTILILFTVPFIHQYITTSFGYTKDIDVTYNTTQFYNNEMYLTRIIKDTNYTLPYGYISIFFRGSMINAFSIESILKMVGLSITYFFLGMYLFNKRKMEYNETSFKSINMHYIVKSITMLPICTLAMYILNESISITLILFLLGLIIAYNLVYDLILTRSIRSIKLGILYFIASVAVYAALYYGVINLNSKKEIRTINTNEIKGVAYYIEEADYYKDSNGRFSKIYLEDDEIINYTINLIKKDYLLEQKNYENSIQVNIKLKNNNEYTTTLYFGNNKEYNNCVNYILNNNKYIEEYKSIAYDDIKLIEIGNVVIKDNHSFLTKLKETIEKNSITNIANSKNVENIILYAYVNHENVECKFPVTIDEDILKEYIDIANKDAINKLQSADYINVYNICNLYNEDYEDFEKLLYNSYEFNLQNSVIKFLRDNSEREVDITNAIKIEGTVRNTRTYKYDNFICFTSDKEGLYNAINNAIVKRGE